MNPFRLPRDRGGVPTAPQPGAGRRARPRASGAAPRCAGGRGADRGMARRGCGPRIVRHRQRHQLVLRGLARARWRCGSEPPPRTGCTARWGATGPVELVEDQAARRIASGESRIALVCGAEAGSSLELALREPSHLGWSRAPGGPLGFDDAMHGGALVRRHGLVDPIRGYPLFENRLRFELGQRFDEAQRESASCSRTSRGWRRRTRRPGAPRSSRRRTSPPSRPATG